MLFNEVVADFHFYNVLLDFFSLIENVSQQVLYNPSKIYTMQEM